MITPICGIIILVGLVTIAIGIELIKHNPKRPKVLMICFIVVSIAMAISIIAFAVGLFTAPRI